MFLRILIKKLVTRLVVRDELHLAERMEKKTPEGTIILQTLLPASLMMLIFPLLFGLILLDLFFKNELTAEVLWEMSPLLMCPLFTLIGVICYFNCRIYYDEEGFTVQNFFRFKRRYSYQEIQSVTYGNQMMHLQMKRRIIHILFSGNGSHSFFGVLCDQGTFPVEEKEEKKHLDLFNGNIENPKLLVIPLGLVLLLFIGIWTLLFFNKPVDPETLTPHSIYITEIKVQTRRRSEDALLLFTEDPEITYRITAYKSSLSDPNAFLKAVDPPAYCMVWSTPKGDYQNIIGLTCNDVSYILPTEEYQRQQQNHRSVLILYGGFVLLFVLFLSAMVYVGRHPEKFSKKIIRIFYRDGMLKTDAHRTK